MRLKNKSVCYQQTFQLLAEHCWELFKDYMTHMMTLSWKPPLTGL